MSKKQLNIMVVYIAILVSLSLALFGCNTAKNESNDKTFEHSIDEKIEAIANPKDLKTATSSNPYDYIKDISSNEDYKYIVSQGDKSLNYLLKKFASSNKNGLEEYIMAIACSEILKEKPDSKNWSTGREWYENYIKGHKQN